MCCRSRCRGSRWGGSAQCLRAARRATFRLTATILSIFLRAQRPAVTGAPHFARRVELLGSAFGASKPWSVLRYTQTTLLRVPIAPRRHRFEGASEYPTQEGHSSKADCTHLHSSTAKPQFGARRKSATRASHAWVAACFGRAARTFASRASLLAPFSLVTGTHEDKLASGTLNILDTQDADTPADATGTYATALS